VQLAKVGGSKVLRYAASYRLGQHWSIH